MASRQPSDGPSAPASRARTILHVDMDAFFVAVELLRRPELAGRPVVVGGAGERGVVAAANYEARRFGVHSAMPSTRARRLCPDAVFLAGDHDHYAEVSSRLMELFRDVTPQVEPVSLDEAFLDVTGARRLSGDGGTIAAGLRAEVHRREGLGCSVGVAASKLVAKMASVAAKPKVQRGEVVAGAGVFEVPAGEERVFLAAHPVGALWGVGPKTRARLDRLGVRTIGDLAELTPATLERALGRAHGRDLHRLARGVDDRPVVVSQPPKSVGHEETFAHDLYELGRLRNEVWRLADGVASRLRHAELSCRTVTLKVRFSDFRTLTRSFTLAAPSDDAATIGGVARELLEALERPLGVRLLGVSTSGLVAGAGRQLSFDDIEAQALPEVTGAVDAVRNRFGPDAIGPTSAVSSTGRLRVARRGQDPWGPSGGQADSQSRPGRDD